MSMKPMLLKGNDGKLFAFDAEDSGDNAVVLTPSGTGMSILSYFLGTQAAGIAVDTKGDPLLKPWQAFQYDARVYRRDLPAPAAGERIDNAVRLRMISRGAARRKHRRLARRDAF